MTRREIAGALLVLASIVALLVLSLVLRFGT